MAVAGLHKASAPDSYLGENHYERLTSRTSSIRKMWRDLESEGSVIESGNQQMNANEFENNCPQNQTDVQNGQENDTSLCVQRSPFDVPEKDRVRKIFHDWGSKGFGGRTRMNNGSRGQKIDENECKRVREWIESSSQQGDTCRGSSEIGSPIAQTRDGTGARNSIRRIFGRQALIDLLKRFKREREIEVEGLLENRFVSNFAHRHRIQSLLKGRFLRNQRFVQVEKQSSVAARDLGLLRKTHAVADIRKGFLSKLNNNDHVAAEEVVRHEISEEIETTDINCDPKSVNPQGVSPVEESHEAQFDSDLDTSSDDDTKYDLIEENGEIVEEMPNGIDEEFDTPRNLRESEKPPLTVELTETVSQDLYLLERNQSNRNPEFDALTEVDEVTKNECQSNKPSVSLPLLRTSTDSFNWQDSVSEYEDDDAGWYQDSLEESYDDNVEDTTESCYLEAAFAGNGSRVELRELTSRRRVSNLLQSDFGTRLDLLMQSYMDRQDRVSESENGVDGTERAHLSTLVMTQTQGYDDLHGATDLRVPVIRQHLGTEPEIINGLRNDLNALRERMNDMQRMLEACMDVQLELQRSVQQEVYSALNRSINSGGACENGISNDHSASSPGKEGACFLCCDNGLESLPNRFAHVYICSKCAEKINWSKLKESVSHS